MGDLDDALNRLDGQRDRAMAWAALLDRTTLDEYQLVKCHQVPARFEQLVSDFVGRVPADRWLRGWTIPFDGEEFVVLETDLPSHSLSSRRRSRAIAKDLDHDGTPVEAVRVNLPVDMARSWGVFIRWRPTVIATSLLPHLNDSGTLARYLAAFLRS